MFSEMSNSVVLASKLAGEGDMVLLDADERAALARLKRSGFSSTCKFEERVGLF